MGYVDLHLHLLPGVDDGSKTMEDSLAMARALVSLGYSEAAPSPHNRSEYASKARALREAKLAETQAALEAGGVPLWLYPNAEHYFLEEGLLASLGTPEARLLGTSGHLLVEPPYAGPVPMLADVVFRMQLKGVTPLIAHPERCFEFEKKGRAAELVRAGALLQLDLGALTGRYGKTPQRLARDFLGQGLYAVAATDLHSPKDAAQWVGEALAALEKAVGPQAFRELVEDRPRALLGAMGPRA